MSRQGGRVVAGASALWQYGSGHRALVWLKRSFILLAVACLLYFGWQTRTQLSDIVSGASWPVLAAAVLAWMLMHLLAPLFTCVVFQGSGLHMAWHDALRIHLDNLPARYLPGGIWHTVGRVVSFHGMGVDAGRISLFVLLENLLAAAVAFLAGGSLLYLAATEPAWRSLGSLAAAIAACVLLAVPVLLRLRRGAGTAIRAGHYAGSIAVTSLNWCAAASAFVLFTRSFPVFSGTTGVLETAGAYLFSWGAGFIAVFAPQGVGVFEVVAAQLLRGSMDLAGVAVLLAGFRVVILAADSLAWLLGRLLPAR